MKDGSMIEDIKSIAILIFTVLSVIFYILFGFMNAETCYDKIMSNCMRDGQEAYQCKIIANTTCSDS